MPMLDVILDGDRCWPDLPEKNVTEADKVAVALLEGGTAEGMPTVTIRIDLPDGRVVLAQTTARLFCLAGQMIMEKHPDLFDDD